MQHSNAVHMQILRYSTIYQLPVEMHVPVHTRRFIYMHVLTRNHIDRPTHKCTPCHHRSRIHACSCTITRTYACTITIKHTRKKHSHRHSYTITHTIMFLVHILRCSIVSGITNNVSLGGHLHVSFNPLTITIQTTVTIIPRSFSASPTVDIPSISYN